MIRIRFFILLLIVFGWLPSNRIMAQTSELVRAQQLRDEGLTKLNNKKPLEALIFFQRSLMLNPDDTNTQGFCGIASYRLGYYSNAIEYYKKSIELASWAYPVYNYMGIAYSEIGCDSLASYNFEKAKKSHANSQIATAYAYNARQLIMYGRYADATTELRGSISFNKDYLFPYYCLGRLSDIVSLPDTALCYFNKILAVDPDYSSAYLYKAKVLQKQGHPRSEITKLCLIAADVLTDNLKNPNNSRGYALYMLRADAYKMAGEKEKMIADLRIVVEILNRHIDLYPHSYVAIADRGEALFDLGEKDAAIRDLKRALAINPHCLLIQEMLVRVENSN